MIVVDTSLAAAWFVDDTQSAFAHGLLRDGTELVAPDLLHAEIASVLLRAVRREWLVAEAAEAALARLTPAVIRTVPTRPFLARALVIAARHGGSLYDAVFIAVAESLGGTLATDDDQQAVTAHAVGVAVRTTEDG